MSAAKKRQGVIAEGKICNRGLTQISTDFLNHEGAKARRFSFSDFKIRLYITNSARIGGCPYQRCAVIMPNTNVMSYRTR